MSRSSIDDELLQIAWGLWSEFGVPGWTRTFRHAAVDAEALIVFTGAMHHMDARLRDEVAGWCIYHSEFLSLPRLRNIAKQMGNEPRRRLDEFVAGVWGNESGWRTAREVRPAEVVPRKRREYSDFWPWPSAIGLRLRATFGVSPRAEVIKALLAYSDVALSAPEMAELVHYTRRNVARALEGFDHAGIVASVRERNSVRYALVRGGALADLAGDLPKAFPPWTEIFWLLLDLRETLSSPKKTPVLQALQAQKFFETHAFVLARNAFPGFEPVRVGDDAWSHLEAWAHELVSVITTQSESVLQTPNLRPTFVRVQRSRLPTGRKTKARAKN